MSAPPPPARGAAAGLSILNPDGTLKPVEQVQAEINQRVQDAQRRAAELRTEIAATSAEATSRNQAATVTVSPGGGLQGIRLNDRVKSMPPSMIAAAVMEAYRMASREAAELTLEITERLSDPRVADMVRDLIPTPPEDPDAAPNGRR